jgi:hypothetical protein
MENWREFEEEIRLLYEMLLNRKDEGVLVTRNAKIRGRSGAFHQIDVYYEFERAGIRHKVAIECKDTKRPVDKGQISEFAFKLVDIGNIIGLVISRNGYQEGAEIVASHYGIDLFTRVDLPSMGTLLAKRLETVALPNETYIGEPFWTIMELRDSKITGSYFATIHPGTQRPHIPLLFCKSHAERVMKEAQLNPNEWAVRGLPRFSLRAFILMLELFEMRGQGAMILFRPPGAKEDSQFISIVISRQQLIDEYFGAPVPSLQE